MVWCNYEFAWGGRYTHFYKEQNLNGCAILEHELQPICFQGQSLDVETGLHYNRFRYYDTDVGMFIQRDPIGLLGGVNVFAYAPNPTQWVDPWGLNCSSDADKLRKNMQQKRIPEPDYDNSAHHIVMSNSTDAKMEELRNLMKKLKIDINDASNGVYLPTSSTIKNSANTMAHPHSRVHTNVYKENIYARLKDITTKKAFKAELKSIAEELKLGTFKIKK